MPVSYIASSVGTTTAALPTGTASGDIVVVWSYRNASGTFPTLPASWTNILTHANGTTVCQRVQWRVYDGVWTMPTFTSATACHAMTFRGQKATTPIGGIASFGAAVSTITHQAVTLQDATGASAVAHGVIHNRPDVVIPASTGYTSRQAAGTNPGYMCETHNGPTTSAPSTTSATSRAVAWSTSSIEILSAPAAATTMSPTGIATGYASGTTVVGTTLTASPTGIASGEAHGTQAATITPPVISTSPTAIASGYASGTATVVTPVTLNPTAIASGEAHGTQTAAIAMTMSPMGWRDGEQNFNSGTFPANIRTSAGLGVASASTYLDAGTLRSDGGSAWWYFNDPAWTVNGNFDITYDLQWSTISTRDIVHFGFWLQDPTTGLDPTTSTPRGFQLRLQSTAANDGGWFHAGGGTPLSGATVTGPLAETAGTTIAAINDATPHRVNIKAVGTVLTATVTRISDSSLRATAIIDLATHMTDGRTSAGTFGQTTGGLGSTEGHRWDNISLSTVSSPSTTITRTVSPTAIATGEAWTSTGQIAPVSSSQPNGTALPSEVVSKLFDGDVGTKWFQSGALPAIAVMVFAVPTRLTSYEWVTSNDGAGRDPKTWTFEGSNNGTDWSVVDTVVNDPAEPARYTAKPTYIIDTPGDYLQYRWNITANQGAANEVSASELRMYGLIGNPRVTGTLSTAPTAIPTGLAFGTTAISSPVTLSPTALSSAQAFGTPSVSTPVTLSPTGIATALVFGTTAMGGSTTLSPSAVASAEAFGTTSVTNVLSMSPTGIATSEAIGTTSLSSVVTLSPLAIASAQSFGSPSLTGLTTLSPTAMPSAEALGTTIVSTVLLSMPTGITSGLVLGVPTLSTVLTTSPSGVATAEAFGATVVSGVLTVSPTGVATAQALGSPSVSLLISLSPTGIASQEAFGPPTVTQVGPVQTALPGSITSAEVLGVPSVSTPLTVGANAIPSGEVIGSPTAQTILATAPGGIASLLAFGTPVLTSVLTATPSGISSLVALGTPTVSTLVTVSPSGVVSSEAVGSPAVQSGITALPVGIVSLLAFGSTTAVVPITAAPIGLASEFAAGSTTVSSVVLLSPTSIASAVAFGSPSVSIATTMQGQGIASGLAFGDVTVSLVVTLTPDGIATTLAFGSTTTTWQIIAQPAGIGSLAAVGLPTVQTTMLMVAVAILSGEAFGSPTATIISYDPYAEARNPITVMVGQGTYTRLGKGGTGILRTTHTSARRNNGNDGARITQA